LAFSHNQGLYFLVKASRQIAGAATPSQVARATDSVYESSLIEAQIERFRTRLQALEAGRERTYSSSPGGELGEITQNDVARLRHMLKICDIAISIIDRQRSSAANESNSR
jgi:hypothetical protein